MSCESLAPLVSDLHGHSIDAGRLKLECIIGEGVSGVVYKAVERPGDPSDAADKTKSRVFAIKVLTKPEDSLQKSRAQEEEISIHKLVSDHPSVVTLHKILEDHRYIYVVQDYCAAGDLYCAIVERKAFIKNDALIKGAMVQILDAVHHLHEKGIYHRDIKPENIFLGENGSNVYLGDFGLATTQLITRDFWTGSPYYMSPECLGHDYNYTEFSSRSSDVWSLGVVLVNMVSGRYLWHLAKSDDTHYPLYTSNPDNFISTVLPVSTKVVKLLRRIFTVNPGERITIPELRAAILGMDTFFWSKEVSQGVDDNKLDAKLSPADTSVSSQSDSSSDAGTAVSSECSSLSESPASTLYDDEDDVFASAFKNEPNAPSKKVDVDISAAVADIAAQKAVAKANFAQGQIKKGSSCPAGSAFRFRATLPPAA